MKDSEFSFLVRVIPLCITFLSKFLACNADVSRLRQSHAGLAREAYDDFVRDRSLFIERRGGGGGGGGAGAI